MLADNGPRVRGEREGKKEGAASSGGVSTTSAYLFFNPSVNPTAKPTVTASIRRPKAAKMHHVALRLPNHCLPPSPSFPPPSGEPAVPCSSAAPERDDAEAGCAVPMAFCVPSDSDVSEGSFSLYWGGRWVTGTYGGGEETLRAGDEAAVDAAALGALLSASTPAAGGSVTAAVLCRAAMRARRDDFWGTRNGVRGQIMLGWRDVTERR